MSEEEKAAIELFKLSDQKIEKLKGDVAELIKTDMGLGHKMDLVMTEQLRLKERFEHSSNTGHKTWESVLSLSKQISDFQHALSLQKAAGETHSRRMDSHDDELKWIRRGVFGVVFVSIVVGVLSWTMQKQKQDIVRETAIYQRGGP